MEVENPHSKIITLINEDYVKMLAKQAVSKKQQLLTPVSTNVKKNSLRRKLKKFVGRPGSPVFVKVRTSAAPISKEPSTVLTITEKIDGNLKDAKVHNSAEKASLSSLSTTSSKSNSRRKKSFAEHADGISWWEPPEENLPLDFCRHTSLHGLKYIGQKKRHMSERIFWMVAFLSGMIVAVLLISDVWQKYNTSPIIVSFQSAETTMDEIPFPAVTVCNMNKVLKSKAVIIRSDFEKKLEGAYKQAYYLDHVCGATKTFTKRFNFTNTMEKPDLADSEDGNVTELTQVNEFLREASQNCSDMIPLCIWQDEPYNCSILFKPIETEFGKCCTFNMVPQSVLFTLRNDARDDKTEVEEWHKWNLLEHGLLLKNYENLYPRRQMQAGKSFGLSFLLNPALNEYYCTSSDSTGFRLATHMPIDTPHVTDFGISVRPKAEVFVNVKPEITVVDPSIFKFSPETRSCYTFGEFPLKYFKYYTTSNCIDECIANRTFRACACKRYYMPRDENQTLCGGVPSSFECAENIKLNISKSGAKRECKMCLESCNEIEYQSQTTTTPLQEGIWMHDGPSISPLWKDENVSIVHVFLGQPSTYARVRKELYGTTDLIANTGGLMGLCLGFSGLSFLELIYFLSLRAYWMSQRKKRDNRNDKKMSVTERFKKAWMKLRAMRIIRGQAGLDNQAKEQKIDSALRTSNSKLQLSPAYYANNIHQEINETETEKPIFKKSDSPKKESSKSGLNRRQQSGIDYKNIFGDLI